MAHQGPGGCTCEKLVSHEKQLSPEVVPTLRSPRGMNEAGGGSGGVSALSLVLTPGPPPTYALLPPSPSTHCQPQML